MVNWAELNQPIAKYLKIKLYYRFFLWFIFILCRGRRCDTLMHGIPIILIHSVMFRSELPTSVLFERNSRHVIDSVSQGLLWPLNSRPREKWSEIMSPDYVFPPRHIGIIWIKIYIFHTLSIKILKSWNIQSFMAMSRW